MDRLFGGKVMKGRKKIILINNYEYWICLIAMLAAATVFYSFFVRTVIPPQTGWWQYMAWRMSEGDLPYKDFFLYVPPYFVLLTRFLYSFFGNHFIYYTLIGFIITRFLMWVILYNILIKLFRPIYVSIGLLTGICITASYLMDQCYDYNPLILMLTILSAFIMLKLYDCEKKSFLILGIICEGVLSGIMLMLKQNVGIFFPIIFLLAIIVYGYLKKINKQTIILSYLFYFCGLTIGVLPGLLYLLKNNIFSDFLKCITIALQAKISGQNFLVLAWNNFIDIDSLIVALLITIVCYVLYEKSSRNGIILGLLIGATTLLSVFNLFRGNIITFINGLSLKNIAILLFIFVTGCLLPYLILKFNNLKSRKYIVYICGWICFIVGMFIVSHFTNIQAHFLYFSIDFRFIKSKLLYICLYVVIFLWMYMVYLIAIKKQKQYEKFLVPTLIFLLFIGASFVSAELEELYAVLIVPFFIGYMLQFIWKYRYIKNAGICLFCLVISLLCLSQKLLIPYDWHGWTTSSVLGNKTVKLQEKGLEGFILPEYDAAVYSDIIQLIQSNSSGDDTLYQFANTLLFNVLTERKTIYTAVPYFDVCPDELAVESAVYLSENLPKLFLYTELSEDRWKIHEQVFRNNNSSGQREIQNLYDNTIKVSYRLLGAYNNNAGENLCLWKKTAYNSGNTANIIPSNDNISFSKRINFTTTKFDTFALYIQNGVEYLDQNIEIELLDLNTNQTILNETVSMSSFTNNYCEFKFDPVEVSKENSYLVKVKTDFEINSPLNIGYNDLEEKLDSICFTFD